MPAALSNRFIHLDFEVNHEDWRHWAQAAGIHPLVTGFISFKPKLLFEMSTAARAFPTPRSWEMLSTALTSFGAVDAMNDLLVGIVGEGAAIEFLAFSRLTFSEERINAIIQNPGTEELPADLGSLYTLVSYLGSWAKRAEVQRAAGVLLGRLSPEIGLLLARDMLRANPRFILDPGYQAFASAHQAFIT
jgi:hypothetical protein